MKQFPLVALIGRAGRKATAFQARVPQATMAEHLEYCGAAFDGAVGSLMLAAKLAPSIGIWVTPFISAGASTPSKSISVHQVDAHGASSRALNPHIMRLRGHNPAIIFQDHLRRGDRVARFRKGGCPWPLP